MQKSNPFAILEYEIVPMNQLIYSFAFWNQTSAPVIRFFDASAFFLEMSQIPQHRLEWLKSNLIWLENLLARKWTRCMAYEWLHIPCDI